MPPESDPESDAEPYLEVTPADGDLGNVTAAFKQLSGVDQRLVTYLVSEGDTVRYILGFPDGDLGSIDRFCRRLFPDSYEFRPTTPPTHVIEESETFTAASVCGQPARRHDWQTRLAPHHASTGDDSGISSPLGDLVEFLADTDATVIYQAVITPWPSWESAYDARKTDLETNNDTWSQKVVNFITGIDTDATPLDTHQERLDHLEAKDFRAPFKVSARVIAIGPDATTDLQGLESVFAPLNGPFYTLSTTTLTDRDNRIILQQAFTNEWLGRRKRLTRWKRKLPYTTNADPCIVTDATTAPHFCLLDPDSLTTIGQRITTHQPDDQTTTPRPNPDTLREYQTDGLTLGLPKTVDNTTTDTPVAVPPHLQPLHVAWVGKTGAGKSTALASASLDNHEATDGASIFIDEKGDGMPREYLQAHYHRHGDLDDVYYLDCRNHLPAISVFDIRDDLDAGAHRTSAVIDRVDHYVDLLEQLMGPEQYQRAIRSTDVLRYLLRACFDPVHGHDAFSHQEFLETITRMQTTQEPPAVSNDDLATALQGVAATHRDTFQNVMHGVKTRVEEIVADQRLTQIFNHTPGEHDPHFRFDDLLNEDCVIILDLGGLRSQSQTGITLLVLAELWGALRRRIKHHPDPPLVNLYLEEASDIAASQILRDLLAKGRGFNVSVTLATQFPSPLRDGDGTHKELLNNTGTIITGSVPDDQALARRLATSDHPPQEVANRLRALSRGEWLARLPAPFNEDPPRPFYLESTPIPDGHPESNQPLTPDQQDAFEQALDQLEQRMTDDLALEFTTPQQHTPTHAGDADDDQDDPSHVVRTTLPHTRRLPDCIQYAPSRQAVRCTQCDNHYATSIDGVKRAIQCCHSLTDVDRDDIPTVAINLKLSPEEIQASDYTQTQLAFLQVVHTAQHQRYTDLEYQLTTDSMIRLREYVGIDRDAIQALIDDGLLRKDTDYPHRLYSLTARGRDEINEATREGLDHGDGHGDLGETSQHRMAVTLGQQYLEQEHVDDPDSSATRTAAYYPIHDNKRLDAAALDDDGEIVAALEAERVNNDLKEAAPADYDKMAACDPQEAIWVAMNRDGAHKILDALKDSAHGEPRVDLDYNKTTAPRRFQLDAPGATQMYTLSTIQQKLD